ncbi:D-alanyl-D-alanine carboxypeptidase precursor [Microbacterium hydrocarbonoxydans]|uniref:D-alanyl-D-alanine carboxypeptidase n=1 Tax=Microbacterium hydrocarbonoxydans TaxID=273678 RepID=A0A0M2HTH6_9MICO|nr:serine hydrolase domain-containing protein [Microbacterium hydrocarbonoxydans]KJL47789.1 D-alanyl-D-alanine carboxypeptidase precursor [Microbacterium hydrocarbonoxydans]
MSVATAVGAVLAHASAPLGAVAGIASAHGTSVSAGGTASLDGTAVTTETAFDLASVTKVAATTTMILRLVAEGVLALDDTVARLLPSTSCAPQTTVRDLLQHRAGLWEWQPLYLFDAAASSTIDELPLRYPPGRERHYSDLGFMLLGRIISQVAGTSLGAAFETLVAEPLGLARTSFEPVAAPVASSALGDDAERRMVQTGEPYPVLAPRRDFPWRDHEILGVADDGNCAHAFGGVAGHAGLFSTAGELLELGSALARPQEHPELWSVEAVTEFFRDGPDQGQALGWRSELARVDGRPERMLWHPGFTGCALGVLPGIGASVVLLSNRLFAAEPVTTDVLWRAALPEILGPQGPDEGTRTP